MDCCSSCSFDPTLDDALEAIRLLLVHCRDATSNIPIPGLHPVASVLISLVDRLMEMRSNRKGLMELSDEISRLVTTIERAMTRVGNQINEFANDDCRRQALLDGLRRSSKLEQRVETLRGTLESLKAKAEEIYHGSWWLRFINSKRDAKTVKEMKQTIAECREYFKLECQVAIEAAVEEVLEKLAIIETKVDDVKDVVVHEAAANAYEREERILESLPHAEASYRAGVNTTKSNFLPGTRVELFDAMDDWVERCKQDPSSKRICILTGGAGTGKSTIASEFARRRDDAGNYGASFFFVRGVADLESTRLVFPTLAYQLAHSQDVLRPHIVNAAREHLKRGRNQQMKFEAPNLLHRPVRDAGSQHGPMFLVIDALDECSEDAQNLVPEMLNLLVASMDQAKFPLRIFFTSRPNSVIEHALRSSQWASSVHTISLHDLSPESVKRDIMVFVRDKIAKIPSGEALLQERPKVAESLAERASGMFIYAKTAMDFLGRHPEFVEGRLDDLLSEGSSAFATELQPLDDLYLTVLEVAFPSMVLSYEPLRRALDLTLGSIAVLRNPVSPAVLESLTSLGGTEDVPRKDICLVLNSLRSVVLYDADKPDEKFRPMHATFPQFLVDEKRCMSESYLVDTQRQHSRLAAGCLRALLTLEENMCQLPDPLVPRADVPDLAARLEEHVPEHVRYACVHWAAHLRHACELLFPPKRHSGSECSCGKILELFASFARTKLRVWVEAMAYMGRLDAVTTALDEARGYMTPGNGKYADLDPLLEGVQQLVVDRYAEIEECAYEVYEAASDMPARGRPQAGISLNY